MMPLLPIRVVCAIIEKNGKTLCVQRSESMELPNKWEFPGGKIEANELEEDSLKREIFEELGISIRIKYSLRPNLHLQSAIKSIELIPFLCDWVDGQLELKEHKAFCWLQKEEMPFLDWAEADIPILNQYIQLL